MRRPVAVWVRRSHAVAVVVGLRLAAWTVWVSRFWMPALMMLVAAPGDGPGATPWESCRGR